MINRTLIRLKVVQMLYAHLLNRNEFKILVSPQRDTHEAVNSFRIYANALALLLLATAHKAALDTFPDLRAQAIQGSPGDFGEILIELSRDSAIKELLKNNVVSTQALESLLSVFQKEISSSTVAYDYKKKRNKTPEDEIRFWTTVILTIERPLLQKYFTTSSDISDYAVEQGCELALETIKSYGSRRIAYIEAKDALNESLEQSYQLYLGLLSLPVELVSLREEQIDAAKNKYIPLPEDLNPNTRFIDSPLVKLLRDNVEINGFIKDHPHYWAEDNIFLKKILSEIMQSSTYKRYMEKENIGLKDNVSFWRKILGNLVFNSDALAEVMEDKNIFWNDDLDIIGSFVLKTIDSTLDTAKERGVPINILPMFRDEEDHEFGLRLFMLASGNYNLYRSYIDRFIRSDWDPERIAFMDIVILTVAIAELINFPNIPLPVTMKEYTDIASDYSTSRSGQFVNGLLGSVAEELKKEGKIFK